MDSYRANLRFALIHNIGDVLAVGILVQPAGDVPIQTGAVWPSPYGVIPAVYRAVLQPQAKALGIALCVAYPVADVEGGSSMTGSGVGAAGMGVGAKAILMILYFRYTRV